MSVYQPRLDERCESNQTTNVRAYTIPPSPNSQSVRLAGLPQELVHTVPSFDREPEPAKENPLGAMRAGFALRFVHANTGLQNEFAQYIHLIPIEIDRF